MRAWAASLQWIRRMRAFSTSSTVKAMRSDTYRQLDRQLAHALQINARAPFSRIAAVLGVSDQTVARRYSRLRADGVLRVHGLADPYVNQSAPWILRVRCAPGATVGVAQALAKRDDTAWVHLTSGGTELVCMVTTHEAGSESLLLNQLPSTPRVQSVTAHYLLRTFARGFNTAIAAASRLTVAQVRMLQSGQRQHADPIATLDRDDRQLLRVLADDGRANLADLAAAVGWSRSAVSRRMADLTAAGALRFDIYIGSRLFPSIATWSLLWLSVEPACLDAVGAALAEHAEVVFAAATTGPTNVYATVTSPNVPALYAYITDRIAKLPGIRNLETAPVLSNVKHHW